MTGEELKALREEAGLTQQELAEEVGTDQSVISLYENDLRGISARSEYLLKRALIPDFEEKQEEAYAAAIEHAFGQPKLRHMRRGWRQWRSS